MKKAEIINLKKSSLIINSAVIDEHAFDNISIIETIDFLEQSHDFFFRNHIPKIEQSFLQLIKLHPESSSLHVIFQLFIQFQINFKNHTVIEEKTIFRYLKYIANPELISKKDENEFSKVSIQQFQNNHPDSEPFLNEIINYLTIQFKNHKNFLFHVLIRQILILNKEIEKHAWIEDQILIKKALIIEKRKHNEKK